MTDLRQRDPKRRNKRHLDFIRSLPCAVCEDNTSTEAAHLRTAKIGIGKDDGGWGRPSDCWATPLCGRCHREQHAYGDELAWWASKGIDPFILAITLKEKS